MLNFTRQERLALLVLAVLLAAGMGIDFYQRNFASSRIHKIPAEESILLEHQRREILAKTLINPNKATLEELEQLPGIGPELAQRILSYRKAHGYFVMLEDLRKVAGIGPSLYKKIQSRLTLNE